MSRAASPIIGIVGVVDGSDGEVDRQLTALEQHPPPGFGGLEVRADLLSAFATALEIIDRVKSRWPVLFTVRRRDQGGDYEGSEAERIEIYGQALQRGAALLDVELGSDASRELARRGAPLLLSHHDFKGMIEASALQQLTREATSLSPLAIKVVPTAERPADGLRMLEWVSAAADTEPRRVGFAMGDLGTFSRVLSLAWGAPFTYGSLARGVAPGQLSAEELAGTYRAHELTPSTRVLGVVGNPVRHSLSPHMHNPALRRRRIDAVYLPFALRRFADLDDLLEPLEVGGLSVTLPFKEDAYRYADSTDAHAAVSGASNTLVFERRAGETRRVVGSNTDIDGVLGPLSRRAIALSGLTVGLLGNGGAARGAARALLEAGARTTVYYRNKAKGEPVAKALGVEARPMAELAAGEQALLINATPLGLKPGDRSPVPSSVFTPDTVAFDMIYDPPDTPFLDAAAAAGVRALIPGREMLICQGLVQFRYFTGHEASYEEFEDAFLRAQRARHRTES